MLRCNSGVKTTVKTLTRVDRMTTRPIVFEFLLVEDRA